jgi:homoserine O-succinyltransferase
VHSTFDICWGAQAALHHFHGVPKHALPKKAWGVFRHRNLAPTSPYLRGFSDDFSIPVSRWTEVRAADIPAKEGLRMLMDSTETGPCLIEDQAHRHLYMFNHIEYDSDSLREEYVRDSANGGETPLPHDYFPMNNPAHKPLNRWRSHAHLLFANWINEIYQTAPFEIAGIGRVRETETA